MEEACAFFTQIIRKVIFGMVTNSFGNHTEKEICLPHGSLLYIVLSESTRRKNINLFSLFFPPQSNRNRENIEN